MEPTKATARKAGFFYLILIASGIFSILYVPSTLIRWDDAGETVRNIAEAPLLFKLGVLGNLVCFTCFILVLLLLYRLLRSVDEEQAALMVIFALTSVPISYLNIAHHIDVLSLIDNAQYASAHGVESLNSEVMLALESYNNGVLVAHIFWGLWLFPFGNLVYRSGFLPRFIGIMLMLGCIGYLIDFLGYFLVDGYGGSLVSELVGIPASVGEIGICLWLLIKGIRPKTDPPEPLPAVGE